MEQATSGPVAPRRGQVDHTAWAKNQVLADELAAARARVDEAREAGAPTPALRRLERAVNSAAERLYTENRGVARSAARSYLHANRDQEELLAVADEALWKAIVSWDPSGSPLANWAFRVVSKACRVHVARIEHGLTAWAWAHRPAVRDAIAELESTGSPVTADAVAELAGCTPELAQVLVAHEYHGRPLSLDAAGDEDGTKLVELLDIEQPGLQFDDLDRLAAVTASATAGDLAMWIRSHGLDGAPPWTTKSLEQLFGVSDETVRRRIRAVDELVAVALEDRTGSTTSTGAVDMGEVVAGLREFASSRGAPPSLACVRTIVDFLKGDSLTLNGRRMELFDGPDRLGAELGLTGDEVCDLVASLGTFLGQSLKAPQPRAAVWGDDLPSATLAQAGQPTTTKDAAEQLSLLPFHVGDQVVLFGNWESRATGRNLRKAVPNIVNAEVDDALLNRWLLRQWANPAIVVSFELVAMVWMLAKLGRAGELGELARLGGGQPSLARALAEAWDILDVSRVEAVEAVGRLCAGGQGAQEVLDEISRCRWLAEGELGRLERVARRAADGEPTGDLPGALAQFAANAAVTATMWPAAVADLNDGQVRRLGEAFQLGTDGDQSLRREVNGIVVDAGLRVDADRLVSLGVAAHRAGLSESFATALERRRAGEVDWADELHEQLGVS